MQNIRQLALEFEHRPCFAAEDFLISKCNRNAVQLMESWPNWPYFALCIFGPSGCGKTHLAHVFSDIIAEHSPTPYKIPTLEASKIKMSDAHNLFEKSRYIIIENLENLKNQEALFHLYNTYRDLGGNILFTAQEAPARLHFSLPDLRSRMNIVPAIEITSPDDELLSALLLKLFADRQIMPSPEIINFILANMERSFTFARDLIAEIDYISLAKKRSISTNIVKEALESLQKNQSAQGELF